MRRVSAARDERAAEFTLTRVEERKEDEKRRWAILDISEGTVR